MYDNEVDVKSLFKVAQLWHIVKNSEQLKRKLLTEVTVPYETILSNVFKDAFNVNYKVTIRSENLSLKKYFENCTALHFTYRDTYDIEACNVLLERGADFTAKNEVGQTVLHSTITSRKYSFDKPERLFTNSILSAHVKFQNATNPQDDNGISHLHVACIVNHVESLKLFLDNGASIDRAVSSESKFYPGYTPLHLAVEFNSVEAMQLLVSRDADVNAKNARGLTPLDVCMRRRVGMFTANYIVESKDDQETQDYFDELYKNETISKLLLDSQCQSAVGLTSLHVASTFGDLNVAESLWNQIVDINRAVPKESSVYPGYTAAHFAARNNADALKILLMRGANLHIEDADGSTPFDICVRDYSAKNLYSVLSCDRACKELSLSDGQTKLLDVVRATANLSQLKLLLKKVSESAIVPSDFLFWQGYTILHLAVITANETREFTVKECLKVGHNVNVPNQRGESAIHLAFKLGKRNIVKLLVEQLDKQEEVTNLVDEDNLSYLHIACEQKNESLVRKLLRGTLEPNVVYNGEGLSESQIIVKGSTPLHVAVCNGCGAIAELLLRRGADLHATDHYGMTPIHCLLIHYHFGIFSHQDHSIIKVLFDALLENPKDCVVEGIGLNYLHVACYLGNNVQVVKKLLELGSDTNAVVSFANAKQLPYDRRLSLNRLDMLTPLLIADNPIDEVIDLLILHGAELFPKSSSSNRMDFPLQCPAVMDRFMSILWDNEEMQKSMEDKLGLTRLHIACYMKNYESIIGALNDAACDVNAQIREDSDIFAGCTPLHLLLTIPGRVVRKSFNSSWIFERPQNKRVVDERMVKLLLDRGASVTIKDADDNTPIQLINGDEYRDSNFKYHSRLLLNAQRDFGINPTNKEGMSHFHLACLWHEVEIVEKFLQHCSIDVNQPIDFFVKDKAGCTPLHLALNRAIFSDKLEWQKIIRIVDLLLEHGADVTVKNVHGDTPLHGYVVANPVSSPDFTMFEKLVSHGADINSENVKGHTPLDNHIDLYVIGKDYIDFFEKYNCQINSWNHKTGEGYIGQILRSENINECAKLKALLKSSDAKIVDNMDRTLIHNCVSVSFSSFNYKNDILAIEYFSALGIDIDHRDKSGQTALHYAARMNNYNGAQALLNLGADVNIVDNDGKSAFSHAMLLQKDPDRRTCPSDWNETAEHLHLHVKKLEHLGIEVSQLNRDLSSEFQRIIEIIHKEESDDDRIELSRSFFSQIKLSKSMDVGVDFHTLFDFLSDKGAMTLYPGLSESDRIVVDDFINSIDYKELEQLAGVIRLQFRKMKANSTSEATTADEEFSSFEEMEYNEIACDEIACSL